MTLVKVTFQLFESTRTLPSLQYDFASLDHFLGAVYGQGFALARWAHVVPHDGPTFTGPSPDSQLWNSDRNNEMLCIKLALYYSDTQLVS